MQKIKKSFYGKIVILQAYCAHCKGYSFLQDGFLSCCGQELQDIPSRETLKREIEGEKRRSRIPTKIKKQILEEQNNKCIYCGIELGESAWVRGKLRRSKIHFDHFVSWNYSQDNSKYNLVASCDLCNLIKSDLYFVDVVSARQYILSKRHSKEISNVLGDKEAIKSRLNASCARRSQIFEW